MWRSDVIYRGIGVRRGFSLYQQSSRAVGTQSVCPLEVSLLYLVWSLSVNPYRLWKLSFSLQMWTSTVLKSLSLYIRLFKRKVKHSASSLFTQTNTLSSPHATLFSMRPWQRDTLVTGLAFTAGTLDSWSYFGLAHVFVANMTGNTLVLGFSLVTGHLPRAMDAGTALLAYVTGVFFGALLSGPVRQAVRALPADPGQQALSGLWPRRTTLLLGLELALILVAASLSTLLHPVQGSLLIHLPVVIAALAVGLQSAFMNALSLPGIVTTYISGTWTTLFSGLAQWVAGGFPRGGVAAKSAWEQRLLMQAIVLVIYCGSAVVSGLLFLRHHPDRMGWLAAGMLTCVAIAGVAWGGTACPVDPGQPNRPRR